MRTASLSVSCVLLCTMLSTIGACGGNGQIDLASLHGQAGSSAGKGGAGKGGAGKGGAGKDAGTNANAGHSGSGQAGTSSTHDSGAGSGAGSGDAGDAGVQPTVSADSGTYDAGSAKVPTFVAVGYAGLRIVSYDLGKTWKHKQVLSTDATDDLALFRAAAYGSGLYVATGQKIFTTRDGIAWVERDHPMKDKQWLGGVAYGNQRFVASGGYGYSVISTDGIHWTMGGMHGTEAMRSLAFGNGMFMGYTDAHNWWSTTDGMTWKLDSGGHMANIAFCNGAFKDVGMCGPAFGAGVYVRGGDWNKGIMQWSTDGTKWNDVQVGYNGSVQGIAFGYTHGG